MTARLLPSHRAVSRLEAAAYDVIDDVLDVLQQVEGRERLAAMSTEALLLWRRQWQDALRKRSASDAQKITWRRFIADADAVLKEREVTP